MSRQQPAVHESVQSVAEHTAVLIVIFDPARRIAFRFAYARGDQIDSVRDKRPLRLRFGRFSARVHGQHDLVAVRIRRLRGRQNPAHTAKVIGVFLLHLPERPIRVFSERPNRRLFRLQIVYIRLRPILVHFRPIA